MGDEINKSAFSDADFDRFEEKLEQETELLQRWFDEGRFSKKEKVGGLEIEAWLVDDECNPQARNEEFLTKLDDPLVVHEISAFNIELNCLPEEIEGNVLGKFEQNLTEVWQRAQDQARDLGLDLMIIGTLPTLQDEQLTPENMSELERYKALNEQILHLRDDVPITLNIDGKEHLQSSHNDVMLEAGATAFQIHLQVPQDKAARFYNISKIISAPLVAVGANSPYLFGKDLWAETRIPLFEQSVSVGDWDYEQRVTFGLRYLENSLMGAFKANTQRYSVVIPAVEDDDPEKMRHVRLQNGTIWRWNRPLIGFDDDGTPHLRIEQRVLSAGPTITDMVANMAFYYGLVFWFAENEPDIEKKVHSNKARDNFYRAAKDGLDADVVWGRRRSAKQPIKDLILDDLLPKARKGLEGLGLDQADINKYMTIIEDRVTTGQNGAAWQRRYVEQNGNDMTKLSKAYLKHQKTGQPVHTWDLKQ